MELDELESQGTFIDFSWYSFDDDGFLPLETAFKLFTNGPRHAITGELIWPVATQTALNQERYEETAD